MGLFERLLGEEPSLFDQWGHDDPGEFGEYLITYALENNNIGGYIKVLKNLYIPIGYGKTTEKNEIAKCVLCNDSSKRYICI